MSPPTLSVLMTSYNLARYLPETLGAILSQSVRPLEVLVVDDASTDDSLEVLSELAAADPLIRVLRPPHNLGAIGAFNYGLGEVRGEYLYHNAADDPLLPGAFEQALALLAQYPQAAACAWDHCFLDEVTGERRPKTPNWSDQPFYAPPAEVPRLVALRPFGAYNCIVSTAELRRLGGLLPETTYFSDCFAVSVVALRGGVCYLPGAWSVARLRSESYGAGLAGRHEAQREMLTGLLAAINSPALADVRPAFRDACLLSGQAGEGVLAAWRDPRSRDLVTWPLVRLGLLAWLSHARERLFPHLPRPVVWLWRRLKAAYYRTRGSDG